MKMLIVFTGWFFRRKNEAWKGRETMGTKKYYLILAVVTGILCIPALGEVERPRFDEQGLLGRANPTLAGIEQLYVSIVPPDTEPNKDSLVREELQSKVEHKLKKAGIKYVKPRSLPKPELRIYIDMLKLPDSQKYVFRIQTTLARTVTLPAQRNLHLPADVWKTEPVMRAASVQSMPAEVTAVVLEQVEAFINCYMVANPPDKQPADAGTSGTASLTMPKEQSKPPAKPAVAEYKYVASKNSKVFHRPDCSSAKRILPKNLVGYNSRDETIKAGKRPCKRCKP